MSEKIEAKNNLKYKLIKKLLPNNLGKRSSIQDIINIIKETTGLTFKAIGYAKSLHFESKNNKLDEINSRIGWHMYNIEDNNSDMSCTAGDSKDMNCTAGDSKDMNCTVGDSKDMSCTAGDIIIYEEVISFDDNKIYNTNEYINLNIKIEEPRYWFWRIIHNRYNNTYTLKQIELGVECTNVKINVPLKIILNLLYERINKYES